MLITINNTLCYLTTIVLHIRLQLTIVRVY